MEPCRLFSPASKSKAFVHSSGTCAGELGFVGFLHVLVQQARDVNNICIYQQQDVYAMLCLTSDLDATVSTRTVNGGCRNHVFDETLRLGVRRASSSLKCEIWMLSKAKSHLEDQLLGFALVPLADILVANGKLLAQDFSLSSTDLFHSPTGFIQLSLSYAGASQEAMALLPATSLLHDAPFSETETPCEHKKIEFKNLKFAIGKCNSEEEEAGVRLAENFSLLNHPLPSTRTPKNITSAMSSSSSTIDSSSATVSPNVDDASSKFAESEADSWTMNSTIKMIDIEPEQTVVHQDIVDMYTKSMQQFTESLTDMKLPAVVDGDHSTISMNANAISDDQRSLAAKRIGPRVFYGSRAFF